MITRCLKVSHGVQEYFMTSKVRRDVKSTSRHQKYVMTSKVRHDVKTYFVTLKSTSQHQKLWQVCYDVKKLCHDGINFWSHLNVESNSHIMALCRHNSMT